jgi:hypothetical protein
LGRAKVSCLPTLDRLRLRLSRNKTRMKFANAANLYRNPGAVKPRDLRFRGRKAHKGICQQASPGSFDSAHKASICDRFAKRFAQDDEFVGGMQCSWLDMQQTREI